MTTVLAEGIANANTLRAQFEIESSEAQTYDKTVGNGDSVIIVGAGAFGSSLALELVTHYRDKYVSVNVFDKWPVPSRDAASTDTTKIVRADYSEPIYAKIAGEAIELWKTELFRGTYHQTGWIFINDEKDTVCARSLETLKMNGLADGVVEFNSGKAITDMYEMFDGPMENCVGYFNPASEGWANAAQATYRVASAGQRAGAIFHTGPSGHVVSLIYNSKNTKVVGIKTASGASFYADKIVLCTGAWTNTLIDTKGQLVPKGHCLGHIQLTPEEHARYANIPVFDDSKTNVYYFPPFEENGVLKIAGLSTGYTVKNNKPRTQSDHPEDGIPKEAEEHLRRGMRASIPSLAEKEMFDVRVCWCVDTPDSHFLITPHPEMSGLYLATGGALPHSPPSNHQNPSSTTFLELQAYLGSAHGFKFLPRIGHYIALMLEGRLPAEFADKWKWRPGLEWKEEKDAQWTLVGKDFEETVGWVGSARHSVMAHTWGNPAM